MKSFLYGNNCVGTGGEQSSQAHSTDRDPSDNTIVMLNLVSVQFAKTLQKMEILCGCSQEQEKKHCLGVRREDQSLVWPQAFMSQLS